MGSLQKPRDKRKILGSESVISGPTSVLISNPRRITRTGSNLCFKCGKDIPVGSNYCNHCGFRLERTGKPLRDPNRLEIPKNKIMEGVDRILSNAKQFLEDAKALLQKGSVDHALGLVTLAAEEAGKAQLLIDEMRCQPYKNGVEIQRLQEARVKVGECFKKIVGKTLIIDHYGEYTRYEQVAPNPFYSHRAKLNSIAHILLNSEIGEWMIKGNRASYGRDSINRMKLAQAGEHYRAAAFYVEFDNKKKKWLFGSGADTDEVKTLISDIKKLIDYIQEQVKTLKVK